MGNHPARILVVEDEESMAEGLRLNLCEEGYRVKLAKDGKEAEKLFSEVDFDLVLLDIMLPYLDGFEVAQRIRSRAAQIPILFLTAVADHESLIQGLSLGGDDYLTKPFHLDELLLRVKGMLRRESWYRDSGRRPVFAFGVNRVDFNDMSCRHGERSFVLTDREAAVLRYFIEERGRIVSRSELLEQVWRVDPTTDTRTVDNFVARLRKFFESSPARPVHFLSSRGLGYRFVAPDLRILPSPGIPP